MRALFVAIVLGSVQVAWGQPSRELLEPGYLFLSPPYSGPLINDIVKPPVQVANNGECSVRVYRIRCFSRRPARKFMNHTRAVGRPTR